VSDCNNSAKIWVAIAYGDTLAQASANYLNIFAAEHYPWHRCQTDTGSVFTPGWQFSVSGAFMPQDAEFDPKRELQQIRQLTQNFYTGRLVPLPDLHKSAMTIVDKQLQAIYKDENLWRLSSPMSEPEKRQWHDRFLWNERSTVIREEMKIG
jgi:hypothetical protein